MKAYRLRFSLKAMLLLCMSLWLAAPAYALDVGDSLKIENLQTIDGQVLGADQLQGQYLVVQVWATWCPFCHRQNLNLIKLAEQTAQQDLRIIALSIDRDPADVRTYAQQHDINFDLAMMTPALDAAIGKRRGIPELYVIDPTGRVVQKGYGQMVDLDIFDLAQYGQRP